MVAIIRILVIVEAERLLIEIPEQVERLDTDVCSIDAPLDQTPEILKSIGMNFAINIRYSGVNNLMLEFVQAFVGFQRIAV